MRIKIIKPNGNIKSQVVRRLTGGLIWTVRTNSTVTDVRCKGGSSFADVIFNFNITYRSPALFGNNYSSYQLFLYQTISEHREKELTFDAIAEWFNKEGYLTLRGKRFKGAHVHSILRKRLAKEELLKREYPAIWSDFSLEVVDKTILMNYFDSREGQ